jgi:ABC-type multidrug transport system fused ATPase/permease subunit
MEEHKHPKYSNWEFARDLWYFFRKHKVKFIFLSFLLVIVTFLGLIEPILIAKIVDFFSGDFESLRGFYILLGALLIIGVVSTVLRLRSKYHFGLFSNILLKNLKMESFQKILQGDLVWHDKENTGNKIQKVFEGEKALRDFITFYTNQGIKLVSSILGILVVFAFFDLKYVVLAIVFMFTYLFVEFKLNRRVAKKTLEVKIAQEKTSGKAYEFSSNINTVKSLGIEKSLTREINKNEKEVLELKNQRRDRSNVKWISVQIIAVLFYSLFILLVGKDIIMGLLTIGSIVIYIDYVAKLRNMLNLVSREVDSLTDVKYGLYRMMQMYKELPEIKEEGAKNLKSWDEINIKNVSFNYKDEGVLENFNLDIKRGEKIGIVGKSGSGKSTFFKLLLKLYLPKKGMIYFDNKPITSIKRNSVLDRISIVPQETEVFNLSLKDNILMAGKSRKNIFLYKNALLASQLTKVVSKLKYKDNSLIGEKGVRLSGGEKQRLGIARAIYKNSDIIIFDESTSNLDYETEKEIQKSIDKIKGKTLIVSAHRLSTLQNMDKIIFLEKGRIVEQGNYEELLKKKGKFYSLWLHQNKEVKK